MSPVKLSDAELAAVFDAARPLAVEMRDPFLHAVAHALSGRSTSAETGVRRGDADRNAPSHPEHREITHYEGHETRIGTHLTLDQQTDGDGDRLPDQQRDEKDQQQLGAFHDCAPCIDCVRASLGGTPRNQSRRDDRFRSACRHNVAGAVTERQEAA
jgi:hypothetical protein